MKRWKIKRHVVNLSSAHDVKNQRLRAPGNAFLSLF